MMMHGLANFKIDIIHVTPFDKPIFGIGEMSM
jgi:hypothetical protein